MKNFVDKMELLLLIFVLTSQVVHAELSNYTFPPGFSFGVATAAYQIEGGWNEGGRGESIWDYETHKNPALIDDKSNGDIACDSYHKWQEDVQLIKNLGVSFYRFSISWTRIIPQGAKDSQVNQEGIDYYNKLIDGLIAEGITPMVTIFHWDTPQALEFNGGWLNESIIDDYVNYARILFKTYGDRVKHWITFNEFHQICEQGYSTAAKAPFKTLQGIGGYKCYHHCAIAHGKTYRLYQNEFKSTQGGRVGVTIDSIFMVPLTETAQDRAAAELKMQFDYGWFANPIILGNYPQVMIERIDALSKAQGFKESRLPKFTEDQIEMIKGSFDFLGLNHYTSWMCFFNESRVFPQPSHLGDTGVDMIQSEDWKPSAAYWLKSVPEGMRNMLVWIKNHYNNPPVIITENGWADTGEIDDDDRIDYYRSYLSEILKAIHDDGCNVQGFMAWSLLDNFEWTDGYTQKYGLVSVDFNSPNRTRTPKKSYSVYQNIVKTGRVIQN